jgi:ATP-dependent DNA ligase
MSVTRGNLPDTMLNEFSLPTKADQVPTGPDWLHEVKYDGYRMLLIRDQARVRLISRGGYDLARDRKPAVATECGGQDALLLSATRSAK